MDDGVLDVSPRPGAIDRRRSSLARWSAVRLGISDGTARVEPGGTELVPRPGAGLEHPALVEEEEEEEGDGDGDGGGGDDDDDDNDDEGDGGGVGDDGTHMAASGSDLENGRGDDGSSHGDDAQRRAEAQQRSQRRRWETSPIANFLHSNRVSSVGSGRSRPATRFWPLIGSARRPQPAGVLLQPTHRPSDGPARGGRQSKRPSKRRSRMEQRVAAASYNDFMSSLRDSSPEGEASDHARDANGGTGEEGAGAAAGRQGGSDGAAPDTLVAVAGGASAPAAPSDAVDRSLDVEVEVLDHAPPPPTVNRRRSLTLPGGAAPPSFVGCAEHHSCEGITAEPEAAEAPPRCPPSLAACKSRTDNVAIRRASLRRTSQGSTDSMHELGPAVRFAEASQPPTRKGGSTGAAASKRASSAAPSKRVSSASPGVLSRMSVAHREQEQELGESNFFVKQRSLGASGKEDGYLESREKKEARVAEQEAMVHETHRALLRRAELLLIVSIASGPYEAITFFNAVSIGGWQYLMPLFAIRYALLTPILIGIISYLRSTSANARSDNKFTAAVLILLPFLAQLCIALTAKDQAIVCPVADLPPCRSVDPASLPAGLPAPSGAGASELLCIAAWQDDVLYCYTPPFDYLTLVGVVTSLFHYSVELGAVLRRQTLLMLTSLLSLVYVGVLFSMLVQTHEFDDLHASAAAVQVSYIALWIALSHVLGVVYYNARRLNLWQHRSLRMRQQRVLKVIEEEKNHCEKLLQNVLPPHLIKHLSALVARAARGGATDPSATPQPMLVAESFHGCTFLFAKVGGLAALINDGRAKPRRVLKLLQTMYDRFDRLADVFQVQKVRKTANEYYLVAAGLPDPTLLPDPQDRACAIAGFGFALLNAVPLLAVELGRMGFDVTGISLQVGLHSGGAIAGIIGHKTFQYDLCGDAVNTAARMCSYSKPSHINISETTYQLLKHRYGAVPRGELQIKGKGKMSTYFLLNMPVEQQEALKALAVPNQLSASLVSVVDRWAKSGKHLVHAAADDGAGGRSGSPGSLPVRPQPPKMGQGKGQSVSMISLPLHTNATAGPEGQAGGAKGAAGRDGGSGGTSLCA